MTQTSQENDASNLPKEKSISQTITKYINIIPVDEIIPNLTYASLMAMLKLLKNHTGTVNIETPHLSWKIFIHRGRIAFIEDESDFLPTLRRKLKIQKIHFPEDVLLSSTSKPLNIIETCELLGKLYAQDRENCLMIFKEILLENLLAISLEKKFSLVWNPLELDHPIILPIWQINDLEKAIAKATKQWHTFTNVRHPYQMVQLLDPECKIAQVPLFTQVTNGKYRICEIADCFQQHITRTALKLDKLAENQTVAILPLTLRSSEVNEDLALDQAREPRSLPKVMIVDDSPLLLKQFGNLLKNWGYQLSLVNDSANATSQMLSEKPDIVFVDINMPNLNGFDLIKQIRRQPSLAGIPLVLVTSENTITNNFRAKWANCRFLSKPLKSDDIQEFREQVRTILQDFVSQSQL
ncbi:signal transduction histidine kinase CheA [Pseudanabaena sp. lw0831]|uniref:response regulator n=1 Tax=Pseudanabaena sp. lw0831 TaxID=1357935 RepID=UPI001916814C|nr:response regulator [Pseudanabaena sp. lw0831]GBO53363.1 signal transduction histidine kinase CheA [Pseudanabaena sp. lw0831]